MSIKKQWLKNMHSVFFQSGCLVIVVMLSMSGCSLTLNNLCDDNYSSILELKPGLTRQEVLYEVGVGREMVWRTPLVPVYVDNPSQIEVLTYQDKIYEVLFYRTKPKATAWEYGAYDVYTPLIFQEGILIGIGHADLDGLRNVIKAETL